MDLGLPTTIDLAIGDRLLSQPIDYWKEAFHCHSCGSPDHLKDSCKLDPWTGEAKDTPFFPVPQSSLPRQPPFDPGSFLGKMTPFFPSFFSSLTDQESGFLCDNESWVQEIFGEFWKILLSHSLSLEGLLGSSSKAFLPGDPSLATFDSRPASVTPSPSLNLPPSEDPPPLDLPCPFSFGLLPDYPPLPPVFLPSYPLPYFPPNLQLFQPRPPCWLQI
jgi:hypothetical protein